MTIWGAGEDSGRYRHPYGVSVVSVYAHWQMVRLSAALLLQPTDTAEGTRHLPTLQFCSKYL